MRNGNYEQQSTDRVARQLPGAAGVLRAYGIDASNRLSLAQAAAAAATTPDEILAVIEDRARRAAQRLRTLEHHVEHEEQLEELVLAH